MVSRYHIWTVSPPDYPHSQCFEEISQSLRDAFVEIGYPCTAGSIPNPAATNVILGANLLQYSREEIPKSYIVYNLEQISPNSPWLTLSYLDFLRESSVRQIVWDYSLENIGLLEEMGVAAQHLPIGYMPCLTRIAPVQEDIDILFVGSLNARRQRILDCLRGIRMADLSVPPSVRLGSSDAMAFKSLNVVVGFSVYGAKRDALIARAKVVLNMHYYESRVFEMARCSYLMANRKCVVSETGTDRSLEEPFYKAVVFANYESLVDRCVLMVQEKPMRDIHGEAGFNKFSRMSYADYLKRVL